VVEAAVVVMMEARPPITVDHTQAIANTTGRQRLTDRGVALGQQSRGLAAINDEAG
jgi:hypothetical protein